MFKPILCPIDDPIKNKNFFNQLPFPAMVSPKIDGIRCIIKKGSAYSRTGKLLPSYQVQTEFTTVEHLDGELVEGNITDFDVYNRTQSHVTSDNKPGDLSYHIFDYTHPDWLDKPFYQRLEEAAYLSKIAKNTYLVSHIEVDNLTELLEIEETFLSQGYEGIVIRNPVGRYKNGRATSREQLIYKLKRFMDDEAIITGFVEQMRNENFQERDELGYAKRSSAKDGLVPANTLGKFIVDYHGLELEVAPGNFNHKEREYIWRFRENYYGKFLKFRFFMHGIKDKPRFPRAVGFRTSLDM
jgi:DNA ligase-1